MDFPARAEADGRDHTLPVQSAPRGVAPLVAHSTVRSPVSLTDGERGVLEALLRLAKDSLVEEDRTGLISVPVADLAGAAGLAPGDTEGAVSVLRALVGRVVEWTSPVGRAIAPLLAEVQVGETEYRCVLSPALRRRLSSGVDGVSVDDAAGEADDLRRRLAEFGLTRSQVERVLELPTMQVERNLVYVEDQLARGREIDALGAYTVRAIQGDWGASAEAARKKRAAVRQKASVRAQKTARALFPPPALALDRAARLEVEEDQRLDEHVAGLTDDEKSRLDAEVVRCLRERAHPGAAEVERAVAADAEASLGPASRGALTAARRDVMAGWLQRGTFAVLVGLSVLAAGCSRGGSAERSPAETEDSAPAPTASPLLGVWDLADVGSGFGECHTASVGFRSDGRYMARSGDQVVVGRYVAEPAVVEGKAGFLVVQRPDAHNARPNCQGVPADVSLATSPPAAFVEVDAASGHRPARARLYFGGQAARPAAHLVRRTLHD